MVRGDNGGMSSWHRADPGDLLCDIEGTGRSKVSLWTRESCASVYAHRNPLDMLYAVITIQHPAIENNVKIDIVAMSCQGRKHVVYFS